MDIKSIANIRVVLKKKVINILYFTKNIKSRLR